MSAKTLLPNREAANKVYDLLISIGGADESSRDSFVIYALEEQDRHGPTEWRFQGHFGFGGKFYTRWGHGKNVRDWYVEYYKEDNTMERAGLRGTLNKKLEELRSQYL